MKWTRIQRCYATTTATTQHDNTDRVRHIKKPALQHVVRGSVAHRVLANLGRLHPSQLVDLPPGTTTVTNMLLLTEVEEDEEHNMMVDTAEDETAKREEAATLHDEREPRAVEVTPSTTKQVLVGQPAVQAVPPQPSPVTDRLSHYGE